MEDNLIIGFFSNFTLHMLATKNLFGDTLMLPNNNLLGVSYKNGQLYP